ncbi:topoisomerase DNA-binding C4 zinc finger domain-containing protein [Candidatus Daviesbacteria bacterium]|nr:topoisomerase DNA-binding C4 zinc finger domain-containing protein [Candidatus Daviesbacteria bacterium]
MSDTNDVCPKCNSPLSPVTETSTGKKLQRCSKGFWNKETHKNEGCEYVKWLITEPQQLDEKCPKCDSALVLQFTRFGKKMKKCSAGGWDKEARKATGCDYVEWINGTQEPLDLDCPECGKKLVLATTSSGKKMEKCSTAGWDSAERKATGCTYIRWLKPGEVSISSAGEEFLPPQE